MRQQCPLQFQAKHLQYYTINSNSIVSVYLPWHVFFLCTLSVCLSPVFCFTSLCLYCCCLIAFCSQRESSKIKRYFTHLKRTCVLWCWEERWRCSSCMDCSCGYSLAEDAGWKQGGSKDIISPWMIQTLSGSVREKIQQLGVILLTNISIQLCLRV